MSGLDTICPFVVYNGVIRDVGPLRLTSRFYLGETPIPGNRAHTEPRTNDPRIWGSQFGGWSHP